MDMINTINVQRRRGRGLPHFSADFLPSSALPSSFLVGRSGGCGLGQAGVLAVEGQPRVHGLWVSDVTGAEGVGH